MESLNESCSSIELSDDELELISAGGGVAEPATLEEISLGQALNVAVPAAFNTGDLVATPLPAFQTATKLGGGGRVSFAPHNAGFVWVTPSSQLTIGTHAAGRVEYGVDQTKGGQKLDQNQQI